MCCKKQKKYAFTLAEVLITLGIIGIVAVLTIPAVIKNAKEAEYKSAYKNAYSIASRVWAQALSDGNIISRPSWTDTASKLANFKAFMLYFKITTNCNSNNNSTCWASGEKYYGLYPSNSGLAFIDNSGMSWSLNDNGGSTGAELHVDTNGKDKPNKYGQDRFIILAVPTTFNTNINASYNNPTSLIGLPVKIIPFPDFLTKDNNHCPSGNVHPCYYKTWLYN